LDKCENNYRIKDFEIKRNYRPLPGEVIEFSVNPKMRDIEKIPQKINYIVDLKIRYVLYNK